eukprot:6482338-Amphidinium_carterae.2
MVSGLLDDITPWMPAKGTAQLTPHHTRWTSVVQVALGRQHGLYEKDECGRPRRDAVLPYQAQQC